MAAPEALVVVFVVCTVFLSAMYQRQPPVWKTQLRVRAWGPLSIATPFAVRVELSLFSAPLTSISNFAVSQPGGVHRQASCVRDCYLDTEETLGKIWTCGFQTEFREHASEE